MSDRPYVFVSYSGRKPEEKRIVRRLLARLFDQPIEVWIYESRDGAIPPGLDIGNYCLEQMGRADLVVAILSDASLNSDWTRMEINYARENGKPLIPVRIDPLILPAQTWPEPFEIFRSLKQLRIARDSSSTLSEIEEAVLAICDHLAVPFVDDEIDGRVPLARRLCQELWAIPIKSSIEAGIYRDLRLDAFECARAYRDGDRRRAALLSIRICSIIEDKILQKLNPEERRTVPYYYPRLLEAFVSLRQGSPEAEARSRAIAEALAHEYFGSLPEDPGSINLDRSLPFPDENLFSLIGSISLGDGRPELASRWFSKAYTEFLHHVSVDPDFDPENDVNMDIAFGLFQSQMFQNIDHDSDLERRYLSYAFSIDPENATEEDLLHFCMGSCLLILRGDGTPDFFLHAALSDLKGWGELLFSLVRRLCNHPNETIRRTGLEDLVNAFSAAPFLHSPHPDQDRKYLLVSLAKALDMLGDYENSLRFYHAFTDSERSMPHYSYHGSSRTALMLLDAVQFHFYWNNNENLEQCCQLLLSQSEEGVGYRSHFRSYVRGLIFWVKGKKKDARLEFSRSAYPDAYWYPSVLLDCEPHRRFIRRAKRVLHTRLVRSRS